MSLSVPQIQLPEVGFFTWNVIENNLVADEVYAKIYGFSAPQVAAGVEIEEVIARIAEHDRERIARCTHSALLTGSTSSLDFAVKTQTGSRIVSALGRCLRDVGGLPSFFSGVVTVHASFNMPETPL